VERKSNEPDDTLTVALSLSSVEMRVPKKKLNKKNNILRKI